MVNSSPQGMLLTYKEVTDMFEVRGADPLPLKARSKCYSTMVSISKNALIASYTELNETIYHFIFFHGISSESLLQASPIGGTLSHKTCFTLRMTKVTFFKPFPKEEKGPHPLPCCTFFGDF